MATPASAGSVVAEANGARSEGVWGGEVGGGYQIGGYGFALRPMVGTLIYRGDDDRYRMETFSNGQSRCRDLTSGAFASDRKCDDTSFKLYGKLEASFTLPASIEIGAGGRYDGGKVRPYGLVSYPLAPALRVHGNVGEEYLALGVRASF
ncbi:hypothetical protein D2V17_17960 [Aurantiacibacter xanthus]|uniref:Porin family protein n=1 Tax=Aurantiacibacter xanthus TaxID=1784712 RepID=A0A3A1P1F4_9SPHN|nr:hypothetical protein D2V17_17960 [Aurantiacibacter xanthus]